jgi:hypothetical protein
LAGRNVGPWLGHITFNEIHVERAPAVVTVQLRYPGPCLGKVAGGDEAYAKP